MIASQKTLGTAIDKSKPTTDPKLLARLMSDAKFKHDRVTRSKYMLIGDELLIVGAASPFAAVAIDMTMIPAEVRNVVFREMTAKTTSLKGGPIVFILNFIREYAPKDGADKLVRMVDLRQRRNIRTEIYDVARMLLFRGKA